MSSAPAGTSAATKESEKLFEQFTTKGIEGFALWTDANQKVLRQLVEFTTATAAETVRAQAELQCSVVQALKHGEDYLIAQQKRLAELARDPVSACQKGVVDGVEGAQRAFQLLEGSAETITKWAERLQQAADQASKSIQSTFATVTSQLRVLYAPER
jgi:hypothetical protein